MCILDQKSMNPRTYDLGVSRRWLLAHGATEKGERALRELVQGPEYDQMMADIREQAEEQRKHARVELRKALVTPELRRQLHIGLSPRSITLWEWGTQPTQGLPLIHTVSIPWGEDMR